jgi:hypothetical protein
MVNAHHVKHSYNPTFIFFQEVYSYGNQKKNENNGR